MVWPCGPYRSHDIPGIQPVFLIPGLVMTVTVRHGLLMALIEIDGLPNFIAWCWFSMANWQCHNQMVSPVTFWHKKNSPHLFFMLILIPSYTPLVIYEKWSVCRWCEVPVRKVYQRLPTSGSIWDRLQGHVGLVIMLLLEVHSFEYGRRLGALSDLGLWL